MTATTSWVIGRGLLGSAVARETAQELLTPSIGWGDPATALRDLRAGLDGLRREQGRLEIYWCAGRAVTASPDHQLHAELGVFREFLQHVLALPAEDRARLTMFLASSVGGAYGGADRPPFTESTPAQPSSEYGRTKLLMEQSLAEATAEGAWRSFVARITNLYGPGQDLSKGQGLLSVIVASYLTRRPVSIYVSLDTLRDYLYEDDCAKIVVAGTRRVAGEPAGTTVVKIVGAMAAQSIGALIGENRRLRGRRPPVVLGQGSDGRGQASDLRVRSEVWTDLDALARTTLPEGIDRLYRAQLASLGRRGAA